MHRAALKGESARHTALTNVLTGRPARGIVNRIMREIGPMNPAVPDFPLAASAIAPLRAAAESRGSGDFHRCGQARTPLVAGKYRRRDSRENWLQNFAVKSARPPPNDIARRVLPSAAVLGRSLLSLPVRWTYIDEASTAGEIGP